MTPTEYLLILSGAGLGAAIGILIGFFIMASRLRRVDRQAWAAAHRFYRLRLEELSKS